MLVYHGSNIEVSKPNLTHTRKNVDFGQGFYTTPIYEQAKEWSLRYKIKGESAIVSIFSVNEKEFDNLKVLKFDTYSEKWLDFILMCRSGIDNSDYDIVIGGIANDKVFNTIELYFDNLIDKNTAIERLKYEKPNLQICFKSQKSIDLLKFERSEKL